VSRLRQGLGGSGPAHGVALDVGELPTYGFGHRSLLWWATASMMLIEGMVFAIALRRLGNHSEAQELSQEVLVKAMQKIGQLEVPAAFGGWLRSIRSRSRCWA